FSDGNFPFEYRFTAPELTATKTNFTLQARAIDTGGNATWSELIAVRLTPDNVPPEVTGFSIRRSSAPISSLSINFSKPIASGSLTPAALRLFAAGSDGSLGTADDVPVGTASISLQNAGRT